MYLFLIFCESAFSRRQLRTKNHASLQLKSDKIQIIRFYLSLVRSVAYGESEVKLHLIYNYLFVDSCHDPLIPKDHSSDNKHTE
jgi:hypothetical protein